MPAPRELQKLLADFGNSIGMPDLALGEEAHCALRFDDIISVDLQLNPDDNNLILFSELGPVPEDQLAILSLAMLRANHFWKSTFGATLSLSDEWRDDGVHAAYLAQACVTEKLSAPQLSEIVERFVATAQAWVQLLSEDAETSETGAEEEVGELSSGLSQAGFIRV